MSELSKLNISRKLKDPLTPVNENIRSLQDLTQSAPLSEFAYVTLLTKEIYKTRTILLACILKQHTNNIDIVVMVTPNISSKVRKKLKLYFDIVTEVNCIRSQGCDNKLTKFNALGLLNYEKILYISNRMLISGSLEFLFELDAPAGVITIYNERQQNYWHGLKSRPDDIDKSLKFAHGVKTSLLLLKPNQLDHVTVQTNLKREQHLYTSPDVVFITNFYRNEWTHIHNKYCFQPWLVSSIYKPICFDMCEQGPDIDNKTYDTLEAVIVWRKEIILLSKDKDDIIKLLSNFVWYQKARNENGLHSIC